MGCLAGSISKRSAVSGTVFFNLVSLNILAPNLLNPGNSDVPCSEPSPPMGFQPGPTTPYSTGRKMSPTWAMGGENFLSRGNTKAKSKGTKRGCVLPLRGNCRPCSQL
jgi:hypothetical protein